MKKVLFIACAMVFMAVGQNANAQFTPSIGLEIALPLGDFGDFATMGVGASAAGEYAVSDNLSVTGGLGYIILFVDDELSDLVKSMSMMPIQAGVRYYFVDNSEGFYGLFNLGITSMSITTEDIDLGILGTIEGETSSDSQLSFGFGAGMLLGESMDVSAVFNIITADSDIEGAESTNYIGVRAAYRFGN